MGGLAQVVERLLRMREAAGSMPPFSNSLFIEKWSSIPQQTVHMFRKRSSKVWTRQLSQVGARKGAS